MTNGILYLFSSIYLHFTHLEICGKNLCTWNIEEKTIPKTQLCIIDCLNSVCQKILLPGVILQTRLCKTLFDIFLPVSTLCFFDTQKLWHTNLIFPFDDVQDLEWVEDNSCIIFQLLCTELLCGFKTLTQARSYFSMSQAIVHWGPCYCVWYFLWFYWNLCFVTHSSLICSGCRDHNDKKRRDSSIPVIK